MYCKTKHDIRNTKFKRRERNLILEELYISVEQITLSNMNPFLAKLMDKLNNPRSNGGFPNSGDISKRTKRRFILENNTIQFRNIELISRRTRRNIEGEAITGEDRVCDLENEGLDVGLDGGERKVGDFATVEGE